MKKITKIALLSLFLSSSSFLICSTAPSFRLSPFYQVLVKNRLLQRIAEVIKHKPSYEKEAVTTYLLSPNSSYASYYLSTEDTTSLRQIKNIINELPNLNKQDALHLEALMFACLDSLPNRNVTTTLKEVLECLEKSKEESKIN
jgi:hypothetical protein